MNGVGTVHLVGAGPGAIGLLTLRAVECLGRADLVLHDRLVVPRILSFAPRAEKVCVQDLSPCHAERIPHVHRVMIEAARQGRDVVRLKGGDPLVFGRGGEEAAALREAGIPFEIVPGVTAALGAASCAGIPLTHRGLAGAVAFITGHEDPTKTAGTLDWKALARFPGTLVFYMGLSRMRQVVAQLRAEGKESDTPAAVVRWATLGFQQTIEATLEDIADESERAGLTAPALLIVGPVVALRASVAWREQLPLFGKRVLITRPEGQDRDLAARLEALGAEVLSQPTVTISPPDDWSAVDDAIARLESFHWLVFTSINGVRGFLGRLLGIGRDLRALGGIKLAAIGPATAEALEEFHLRADLVPSTYRSEDLAEAMRPLVAGRRVLLARADRGREVLRESLADIAQIEQVAVYSQKDVSAPAEDVRRRLAEGSVDLVILTSSNIARSLHRMLDESARETLRTGRTRIVSISPVTSAAVRELGWPVAVEAEVFTTRGILDAIPASINAAGGT